MRALMLGASLMSGCATTTAGEPETIPVRGDTGHKCDASSARGLVGKIASQALAAEAMRLTGAGTMRWVPEGGMVTMDYREDRLNIHLDRQNRVARIACG
jgi:hypothetical protein